MGKLINLKNQRFGFWVVLDRGSKSKSGQTQWLCQCECGITKEITSNSLRSGNSTSCGCNHSINLVGRKFGKLLVLDIDYSKGRKYWKCKCECGEEIILPRNNLNKTSLCCECYKNECTISNDMIKLNHANQINYINLLEQKLHKFLFFPYFNLQN